jgi:hypothetical protein
MEFIGKYLEMSYSPAGFVLRAFGGERQHLKTKIMKKIINKKIYNTETATLIAEYWNGLGFNDFRNLSEDLYKTKNGQWFLRGSGGAMSKYSESNGNMTCGSSVIILLSESEACRWLEEHDFVNEIEENFAGEIQEG